MKILKNQQKLDKIFEESGVVLAYLFGSAVRNKLGPLSDIDIAVLFLDKVKKSDYFDKRLKIASEIDKILKTNITQVICLNEVPLLLRHRAVFYGIPIFIANPKLKKDFELQTLQEYEDFQYHLQVSHKIMKKQIKEGTFGKPLISPFSKYLQKYVTR